MRMRTPQKHSAVPEIIACGHELGCSLGVGLFGEAAYSQRFALKYIRPSRCIHIRFRRDWAECRARRYSRLPRQSQSRAAEFRDSASHRRSRDRKGTSQSRRRIFAQKQKCGQSDRGRGISSHRFGEDLRPAASATASTMAGRRSSLVMIQKLFRRGQRQQARHGLLDHRLLAVERQQLLGALFAAERPEARAAPASQNYGIEIRVLQPDSDCRFQMRFKLTACVSKLKSEIFNLKCLLHSRFRLGQRLSGHIGAQKFQGPLRTHAEIANTGGNHDRVAFRQRNRHPCRAPRSLRSLRPPPESAPNFPRIVVGRQFQWFLRLKHVHHKVRGCRPAARGRFLLPLICCGAGRTTFPDFTFSFTAAMPSFKCNSRGRP